MQAFCWNFIPQVSLGVTCKDRALGWDSGNVGFNSGSDTHLLSDLGCVASFLCDSFPSYSLAIQIIRSLGQRQSIAMFSYPLVQWDLEF